jgi:hypothetical protein
MNDYLNEKKMMNVMTYAGGEKKVNGSYVTVDDNGHQYNFPLGVVARAFGVPSDINPEMEVTLRLMDLGGPKTAKTLPSYGANILDLETPERLERKPKLDSPVRYIV